MPLGILVCGVALRRKVGDQGHSCVVRLSQSFLVQCGETGVEKWSLIPSIPWWGFDARLLARDVHYICRE